MPRCSLRQIFARAALGGVAFMALGACAAEIRLIGGSAVIPAMKVLIPQFEHATGHKVTADLDAAIGAIARRVESGEAADVAIVSVPQMHALEKSGWVASGARPLARVGVGAFVRKGARRPDISTVAAFREAMLAARSIGFNDPAAGAPVSIYLLELFDRLGIREELKERTVAFKQRSERFGAIARGDVEIGFNQISEIIAVPEVDLVGPLPPEIQNYTEFAAGVPRASREPGAAQELVEFLVSAPARAVFLQHGFEPPQ